MHSSYTPRRRHGQRVQTSTSRVGPDGRLHTLFQHLSYRKESRIAVVAVARELVGFLWAVMQDVPDPAPDTA